MNIFRYYNQNRKTIWLVIIAIIILIIAIQAINGIIKQEKSNKNNEIIINKKDYENNLNINVLISDETVKEEKELVIDQFLRYCNASKIEEAYSLLTENCKEQLFPSVEYFKQNYYNIHFSNTKLYSKENYRANTYKVTLYDDILSTGSINKNSIEDYYTIETNDGISKINISNYIGEKSFYSKGYTDKNLQVKVVKKQVYKEYEQYEIQVTNLTYNTILLDSKENTKTIYLVGKNDVKYYSLSHEVLINNLIVKPKSTTTIFIKYNKEYNSNQTVNKLVFSDIILDYDSYQNKNEKADRETLIVNM